MRLIDIYNTAVRKGIENDPRTRFEIRKDLLKAGKEFRKLTGADKRSFDRERLKNPYADTRILYGDPLTDVRKVMVGIDMEGPELLAADRMASKGEGIDLVIANHPEGKAWAGFHDVMRLQVAMLSRFGIPNDVADDLLKERMEEVSRAVAPANHSRSVDIARLVDMPFMCVHTPADNHVATYLQRMFDRKKARILSQVVQMLKGIPEYVDGMKKGEGPKILIGEPGKDAGRVFVDMTGGTEGSKKIFPRLSQAGVGTIVAMHLSEEHFKSAKGEHINVVIAGHIASDTLGLNLLLDSVEKIGPLEIVECSGFVRVRRGR